VEPGPSKRDDALVSCDLRDQIKRADFGASDEDVLTAAAEEAIDGVVIEDRDVGDELSACDTDAGGEAGDLVSVAATTSQFGSRSFNAARWASVSASQVVLPAATVGAETTRCSGRSR
jgi:hypothetical protein